VTRQGTTGGHASSGTLPRRLLSRYSSFLLRFWRLETGTRIEVEHIQSGGRLNAPSLAAAIAWMNAQGPEASHPTASGTYLAERAADPDVVGER
jgi:hypothetical protein